MQRRFLHSLFAILLLPHSGITAAGELPAPLVQLDFSRDLRNTGTLAGEGELMEYAPGQGPAFGLGIRGNGLDLSASARGGGSDKTPAGGGVKLKAPGLGRLNACTLALWFQPVGPNSPARLLFLGPCWDLNFSDGVVALKIKHRKQDVSFPVPRAALAASDGAWQFLAVAIDRRAGETRFYHAADASTPRLVATWTNMPPFDAGEADLEIGNLGGIRPFRGLLDGVRIFPAALNPDQIAAVATADSKPERGPKDALRCIPALPTLFHHSDVCFTSRTKHTNSVPTLTSFRANRLLWTYTAEKPFTDACRAAGIESFQCAINSLPGTAETEAHALDLDGHPMVAPWMRAFSPKSPVYWACNNRPRFMEVCIERVRKALAAGADMIQFDDWALIASAENWGGACFCPQCLPAFRDDLKRHATPAELGALGIKDIAAFDYREFLRANQGITNAAAYMEKRKNLPTTPAFNAFHRRSIRAFFAQLKQKINAAAGRPVPLSINSNLIRPSQQENFLADIADFFQGEMLHFPLDELALAARTADALGRWHVFVTQSLDVPDARAGIAAAYALGQLPMVPWDMYMGSDATKIQPRGWGTVEEYGDLFRFVRDNPALFDDHESLATVGVVLNLDRFDRTRALAACRRLLDAQVPFAIVPFGHAFYEVPLQSDRLSSFELLLTLDDPAEWTESDRQALATASRDTASLPAVRMDDRLLRNLSAFDVWGPYEISILPRATRRPDDRTLLCHVLNRAAPDPGLKWFSFLLRPRACPGKKLLSARWHTPGQPAADLEYEILPRGIRFILPRLPLWGVAELSFE